MPNDPIDLRRDYFVTLRDEIKATKARTFAILVLGVVGSPFLTYFAVQSSSKMLHLVAPLAVLLLLVLYLSEQTMLMRAGRYIRTKIETEESDWEHWVGGFHLRSAEQQLFAMFVVISLFFYTILTVHAVNDVLSIEKGTVDMFNYYFWKYGVLIFYSVSTLWALGTMMRFWHVATSTGGD